MRPNLPRTALSVGLTSVFALAASALSLTVGPVPGVQAAAQKPEPGSRVFLENFENTDAIDPPLVIREYESSTGVKYTASDYWSDPKLCNGVVVSPDSVYQDTWCSGSQAAFEAGQAMSAGLNGRFGEPGDDRVVFSETSPVNATSPDFDALQISTGVTIPVTPKRFYTGGYDTAVLNCQTGSSPLSRFELETATAKYPIAENLNGCELGETVIINQTGIGERESKMARLISKDAYLIKEDKVGLNVYNDNDTTRGNDGVYDNLQVFDVTPHLDKEFETPAMLGTTTTMRFTVTNTYGPDAKGEFTYLGAKAGWSFTDQMPAGLEIVGTPKTGTGAEACTNFDPAGTTATQFAATGDLVTDQVYCIMEVEVIAKAPGEYINLASDVDPTGLIPPDDAKLEFIEKALVELDKTGTLNDLTKDELGDTGDEVIYKFVVRNTGNSTLNDIKVTDPLVGSITCEKTSLPVGESTNCVADKPYIVTQADTDLGEVVNQATVNAVSEFDTPATDLSDDPTDDTNKDLEGDGEPDDPTVVPLDQVGSLKLEKSAGTPVDVNNNGYADAGDTIQFNFVVTNTGTVTMDKIVVTDPTAGKVTCEATKLAAGESTKCAADNVYVITAADVSNGVVVNVATATGTDPAGKDVISNEGKTTTTVTKAPVIAPPTTVRPPQPQTGAPVNKMVMFAFALLAFGSVLLVASRRRFAQRAQ